MAKAGDAYVDIHGNFAPLSKAMAALPTTKVGRQMQAVGKSLTTGLTLPIVGLGVAAVKLSRDFGGAMRLISTQAGASRKEMENLKVSVLDLVSSGAVKQTPKELADALFHIESVGYRGAEAMKVLKASADLASVGQADMEGTTYALTSALETGIKGTESMREAIGTLNAIVGSGDLRMEDLTTALGSGVLIAAKQVGLSLRDVGAGLDLMTARGMPATQAATRLRMTFTLMAAPTTKAQEALKSIGLDSEALAKEMQKPKGLVRAITLLKEHLEGMSKIEQTQLLAEAFGGARSGTTIMGMVQNLGDLNERFERIGESAGNFNEKLKEVKAASGFKLDVAWSQLEAALIRLGDVILPEIVPAMTGLVGVIQDISQAFKRLPDGTQKFIVQAGIALAALGPLLWVGGKMVETYGKLAFVVKRTAMAFGLMSVAETAAAGASGAGVSRAGWLGTETAAQRAALEVQARGMNARQALAAQGGIFSGIAGSSESAGVKAAKSLVGGLARTLGPAVAAIGIGNIIVSATSGDWRDAGFEAGGALAGGIAGFMVGGPLGAMLGVGIGSVAGELGSKLFGSLFDSEQKLSPLQQRLADTSQRLAEAMRNQASAGQNLTRANQRLNTVQQKQHQTNAAVRRATDALAQARKRYGQDSDQAARAEARLRNQKALSLAADRRASTAERVHGVVRRSTIRLDRAAVSASKEQIEALEQKQSHLLHLLRIEQKQPPSTARLEGERRLSKRLNDTSKQLTETKSKEARVIKEAAAQIGGKFARSLEKLSASQLRVVESGRTLKQANREMAEAVFGFSRKAVSGTGRVKTSYERLKGAMGPFRSQSRTQLTQASGDVADWSQASTQGVGVVQRSFSQFAQRLGISAKDWNAISFGGKQRGGRIGRQEGGVVPGSGVGDKVNLFLPWGSFVLNRKATAAFGFQAGGLLPVAVEPRERVFLPHEVQQVGPRNLEHMNRAVPRFQDGGKVGLPKGWGGFQPPMIVGPDPLRSVGQVAVNRVFEGAVKVLKRLGGNRTYQAVLKEANRIDALHLPYVWGGGHQSSPAPPAGPFDCSGAVSALLQGAGFKIPTMVSSGFESFGEAGQGQVSVLANPEHVYTVLGGRAWGTSGENPGGGAGWIDGYTYRPGFTVRHADVIGIGQMAGARRGRGQPAKKGFARGGWLRVGATIDPSRGQPSYPFHGGMSFAELLVAGANAGLKDQALYRLLGIAESPSYPYGMPMGTSLMVRAVGASQAFKAWKNDVGSGQEGDPRYKIDLHQALADAIHFSGKEDIEVSVEGGPGGTTSGKESVPKAVGGSYTKRKPGQTSPGGGTYGSPVKGKYRAQTSELKFGPLPKTEEACRRELHHLERQLLPEYRAAAKQHDDEPETRKALQANVRAIEKRVREVRSQLTKVRLAGVKKHLTKRILKQMKRITGWESAIESQQRAYEVASQYAEQVVDQEPTEPNNLTQDWVEKTLTPYIRGKEEPAFMQVLGSELGWRNTILRGEEGVGSLEVKWVNQVGDLAERIGNLKGNIGDINDRIAQLGRWIKAHPDAKDRPRWIATSKQLQDSLPDLHARLNSMRGRRKQLEEALTEAKQSFDPWKGTGSFEESLSQVQGLHWPELHEQLAALPATRSAGSFGGAIWDTQGAIEELGLKIAQATESASGGSADESERTALLEQIAREAVERTAISQAQYKVLEGFTLLPNFGGSFATGGIVPGPAGAPRVTITHGQEGVFTPEQMAALGGSAEPTVVVHGDIVSSHPDPVELVIGDKRFPLAVEQVTGKSDRRTSRGVSRGLPGKSGVFG